MVGENKFFEQDRRILKENSLFKNLILSLCLLFYTPFIFGQNLREFKEISVNESKEYLLNNQKPLPYLQSGFHHFSRLQDETFSEVLDHNWEKFPVTPGTPVPKSRKFDPAPIFIFEESAYHNPQFLPCFTVAQNAEVSEQVSANLPRIRKPEYTSSNPLKLSFKFYGNSVSVSCDRLLSLPVAQPVSKETIAEYWKKFMVGNSHHLVDQLMTVRDRLGINDWGYFALVKSCASALSPNDETGAALLTWGLMLRSGFDVRVGYNQLGVSVLYATASKVFGLPAVKINGSDYYIDKPIAFFPISTYNPAHQGATGTIHLRINRSLNFQGETVNKKIQFVWSKKTYEFNLKFNPEVIRFLEDYPQTDPDLYFDAPFTAWMFESLMKQLKPILAGMRKEVSVAFLQQFVQKSFDYHPYNDRYGFDRFMFPEELLCKEESNDKGKSLLYAWLITHLLNQKAALVEFPGFYSVAISLDQPLDGDNFQVEGKSYTIADPTFDNAPLGLVMKEFYPLKPIIRLLGNESEALNEQDKIWKLARGFGAERSGSGKDYLMDEYGNSYITGFFNEKKSNLQTDVPTPFIAKFDENNSLTWMVKFQSTGSSFGLELNQLDRNEFYLAGTFRGKLACGGMSVQSPPGDPDLFFAQFNRQGEIEWISKCGLDELEEDAKSFYVAKFTRSGDIQSVRLSNEDERTGVTGFRQSTNEGLCYVGSRYQTTGMDKTEEEQPSKPSTLFRQNWRQMKQLGIEKTMCTIAAICRSLSLSGNQLAGTDLLLLLQDKTQPMNALTSSQTELLQSFKLLQNRGGIIQINTVNATPVKLSFIKFFNSSHVKILPLDNDDLKIKVIDGIEFETGTFREKINSFVLELSTGNIVFDLGREHLILSKNLNHELSLDVIHPPK